MSEDGGQAIDLIEFNSAKWKEAFDMHRIIADARELIGDCAAGTSSILNKRV